MLQFVQYYQSLRKISWLLVLACCVITPLLGKELQQEELLSRKISIHLNNRSLKMALDYIALKYSIPITYSNSNELTKSSVSIDAQNKALKDVLGGLLAKFPLDYQVMDGKVIIIRQVKSDSSSPPPRRPLVKGMVTDSKGVPLPGATVKTKDGNSNTVTDENGQFALRNVPVKTILQISFIGFKTKEITVSERDEDFTIILDSDESKLNEVQVIGYGTTTKRLNTGSVSTITAADIEKQPVTNVLSVLSGRASGVFVQTTNGLPGGNISIQIRGKGSILAGTGPLYIIDGVPFASNVVPSNNVVSTNSINGVVSPLNSLNPSDIESINILKDADATAIYGSRGTNGVVLITTKKGKAGKTTINATVSNGITKIANYPKLLNLQQGLQIRREAFANDRKTPSALTTSSNYAPDLTVWDTTKSTDWTKFYFGGTGHSTDAQVSMSGGSSTTTFNVSGNYHGESTVLPGDNFYKRGGLFMNLQHKSLDNKFSMLVSGSYTSDNNQLVNPNNLTAGLLLPPDYPIYDATGNYNWYITNPVAALIASSQTNTDNLVGNLTLNYTLMKGLNLKLSTGYNKININQTLIFPTASLSPGATNYTDFGINSNESVIIEPQLSYNKDFKNSQLIVLVGGTYQNRVSKGQTLVASNFSNQGLMDNLSSAATVSPSNTYIQYKYESVFGRVTYNLRQKYILNATVRRDGSSRFAKGNQFGNFGSIGAAWIFSIEDWIKDNIPFLSYGKLRSSYGLTGNDQITDYQYLSTYGSAASYNYQNIAALRPSRIANSDFHWETTQKLEFALELGFLRDRILFNTNRYINDSHDQLVSYAIPGLTGFSSYQANLPATVENSGWEFELNTKNIQNKSFNWSTTINFTRPKNILKSFDNFATSSYVQTLQLGYDITRIYGYQFLGLNPTTGLANYGTQPGSTSTSPNYYSTMGKQTPDFYGGVGNTFTYKVWQLDIFGQFAKQTAKGGITYTPGLIRNNYTVILNHWQQSGDQTNVPKSSTVSDPYYSLSSANFFDASYFRLKNVSVSYSFSQAWLHRAGINQLRIYAQGQNLYTWWNKNSAILDPESGAFSSGTKNIPPMKTMIIGLQISL